MHKTDFAVRFWRSERRRRNCQQLRRHIFWVLRLISPGCVDCGTRRNLEPDHIHGTTWTQRKLNQEHRLYRMLQEAKEGKLVPRCRKHNAARNQSVLGRRHERA